MPRLPRVYFVPRGGTLVRFSAELRDDLCELRGELELLRRIRRMLAAPPPPNQVPTALSRDFAEILQILRDAEHPVVDEMVDLFDREFPDIRGEIAMSVINEEAENIVQEVVDNGVVQTPIAPPPKPGRATKLSPDADTDPSDVTGMSAEQTADQIESALAEAEAALAQVVGHPTLGAAATEPIDAVEERMASNPNLAETTVTANQSQAPQTSARQTSGSDSTRPNHPYTPKRAVQAVEDIEQGVRKLATFLSTEIDDQWRRASDTLEEIIQSRDRFQELASSASASLDAILQLRSETQVARDDADAIRREAQALRSEVQRAKDRAEAAAHAAEIAADQAAKECAELHRPATTVTQSLP